MIILETRQAKTVPWEWSVEIASSLNGLPQLAKAHLNRNMNGSIFAISPSPSSSCSGRVKHGVDLRRDKCFDSRRNPKLLLSDILHTYGRNYTWDSAQNYMPASTVQKAPPPPFNDGWPATFTDMEPLILMSLASPSNQTRHRMPPRYPFGT